MGPSSIRSSANSLDLPKILHHIAGFASSDLGIEASEKLEPCSGIEAVSVDLNRVTEMKSILESGDSFPIDGIKDIRLSIQRSASENSVLGSKELYDIATTLKTTSNIKKFIEKRVEILPELSSLTANISILKEIEFNIFQAIDENAEIKDSASKELKNVRHDISQKQNIIKKTLEKILRASSEQGMTRDEIVTTRDGRMVIPIKSELKNKFPGFIHSTSASGQTVFIEPSETLTLNNDICELIFKEKREIEKILRELTVHIRQHINSLMTIVSVLKIIDLTYAKARYSIEIQGNKPFIKTNGSLIIQNGYHPILLLRHHREMLVPLTVEIGSSFRTLLISGPNAGGKTVALKTIGLLSVMLQYGIHIPVSPDSEFPYFTKMFVMIGDNQSIENDLSTFSSQIIQLKEIVEKCDASSLVLMDEIGSSTDPAEGGAIAASILEFINGIGALTVSTSHQAVLKAFAHNSEGMENAAMEFDQDSLLPTYKLKLGIPGSSYALEIAERFGLNESLIERSRNLLGDQKTKLEQLILNMETQSQIWRNKNHEIEAKTLHYNELVTEYENKSKILQSEIKDIKKKAIEESRKLLIDASSKIEQLVKEIKTQQAGKNSIVHSKSYLSDFDLQLQKLEIEVSNKDQSAGNYIGPIAIDDIVTLKSG
ncbi:MAG: hypothetical protein WCT99_06450, partial [Bacteroidota bacterium]